METDLEFDERIKRYERRVKLVNGKGAVVNRVPGTRIYQEVGFWLELRLWMKDVQEAFEGELVPFEWVADYVGVSRAALHKRVNRGGLTVLAYTMQEHVRGILGGHRERMRAEYKFVPRLECDRWRAMLAEQRDQQDS